MVAARSNPSLLGVAEPRISRSEAVARTLENDILSGALPVGTRLGTKEDLRKRFSVAVASVNEAVRLLETRGLVEARPGPGGGVFVAAPSPLVRLRNLTLSVEDGPSVAQALSVRNALELPVCLEAARHHKRKDIVDLRRQLKRMTAAADDPRGFLRENWRLHRRIAEIGHNPLLSQLYLALLQVVEESLDRVTSDTVFPASQNVTVHEKLVDAIEASDEPAVARALIEHSPFAQPLQD